MQNSNTVTAPSSSAVSNHILFSLGMIVLTNGVYELLEVNSSVSDELPEFIHRHSRGDWGSIDAEDKAVNDEALIVGGRLMSVYVVGAVKIWIITEADRSATTVLLPEEY